jgi:hypothetical protein
MIVINAITAIIGAGARHCVAWVSGLFEALELACLATRSKPGYTRWLCPFWAELLSTFFRRVSPWETRQTQKPIEAAAARATE